MKLAATRGKFVVGDEPIAGYVLLEIIGSGGYGEVWKASAPGGLIKAVKIIYGTVHDRCAVRELKSLNRVKAVQHPFLLSIERIEVVDNRLLIVTEIAETCLKRRFLECCRQGLPGVPRDELLRYLSDAADALDFIRDTSRLQHLDVKPENLLINGGHIKVADFGLIKDLEDTKVSLVSGLTPLYAPPELFDGRPDLHSDQYSLAVVYQEMLTGIPPFTGRTTAQLAAQHLKSPPTLTPLPLAEQAIVAKALAKEPTRRFAGCREFVEALRESTGVAVAVPVTSAPERRAARAAGAQEPAPTSHAGKLVHLDELEPAEKVVGNRPTIIIGVGGLGTRVLQELRSRIYLGYGRVEDVPCVQLLAIDTDVSALAAVSRNSDPHSLLDVQTLALPLRSAAVYRRQQAKWLAWMSRRWLFNVPRSLKTESIRPLGRLALVDHWRKVADRLRVALSTAISPESISASAANQRIEFQPTAAPRVFIVAATSGGTGSGMVADLAYGVRGVMESLGLSAEQLSGVLIHTNGRGPKSRDIALANSYVCLKEIEHYSAAGSGYPGDPESGLAPRWTDHATFSHLYFIRMHEDPSTGRLDRGLAMVGEYLFRATFGSTAEYLDRARETEVRKYGPSLTRRQVRSFGVHSLTGVRDEVLSGRVNGLCHSMWRMLLDEPETTTSRMSLLSPSIIDPTSESAEVQTPKRTAKIRQQTEALAQQLDLEPGFWIELAEKITDRHLEGSLDEYAWRLAESYVQRGLTVPPGDPCAAYWETAYAELEAFVGLVRSAVSSHGSTMSLADALQFELAEPTRQRCVVLRRTFEGLVDDPQENLVEIQRLGSLLGQQIADLRQVLEDEGRTSGAMAETIKGDWFTDNRIMSPPTTGDPTERLQMMVEQLAAYIVHRVAQLRRRSVASSMLQLENAVSDLIDRLHLSLGQLCNRYRDRPLPPVPAITDRKDSRSGAGPRNARRLWRRVRERCLKVNVPLTRILLTNGRELEWLAGEAEAIARRWVHAAWRSDVSNPAVNSGSEAQASQAVALGLPAIAACGGAVRFIVCGPPGAEREKQSQSIGSHLQGPVVQLDEPHGPMVLCVELEQTSLRNVTGALLGSRSELVETASRLRTRIDIEWSFLQ